MREIEQKFRLPDPVPLIARLTDLGAVQGAVHIEQDHYLNAPDRDFALTGEAFRLRRVGETRISERNFLTYKAPKEPGEVKRREEIELPLPPGDAIAEQYLVLFARLGYRIGGLVRKRRTEWSFQRQGFALTVCVDDVEHLGMFCEVETLAEQEQETVAAIVIAEAAHDLGLTQLEPRSYLRMVLEISGS